MPEDVKVPSTLKDNAADVWKATFVSAYQETCAERDDRDECAAKIAWSSVKERYRKDEGGTWVEKAADSVVSAISSAPEIAAPGFDTMLKPPKGVSGAKLHRWTRAYLKALEGECRNSDQPDECAREHANEAVDLEAKSMDIKDYTEEYVKERGFNEEKRTQLSSVGKAMENGAFPIETCADVNKAIGAIRRTDQPKDDVINFLHKRVSELGCRLPPLEKRAYDWMIGYSERSKARQQANLFDADLIARSGGYPIVRPDRYSSNEWGALPLKQQTVEAESLRRIIERNYAQAVEDAQLLGYKAHVNHFSPEEFVFSKDADGILTRSVLVRSPKELVWELRHMSKFAEGTMAARIPGVVRHIRSADLKAPVSEV